MSITKKLGVAIVLVVVVVVGVVLWKVAFRSSEYHAIFLQTGDLYFGKLTRFPNFGLKNVYLLQVNPENTGAPLSVQRFQNIFWGPQDYIKINREQVVWSTELSSTSQLAELLRTNPDLLPQLPTDQ